MPLTDICITRLNEAIKIQEDQIKRTKADLARANDDTEAVQRVLNGLTTANANSMALVEVAIRYINNGK